MCFINYAYALKLPFVGKVRKIDTAKLFTVQRSNIGGLLSKLKLNVKTIKLQNTKFLYINNKIKYLIK